MKVSWIRVQGMVTKGSAFWNGTQVPYPGYLIEYLYNGTTFQIGLSPQAEIASFSHIEKTPLILTCNATPYQK